MKCQRCGKEDNVIALYVILKNRTKGPYTKFLLCEDCIDFVTNEIFHLVKEDK